MPRKKPTARTAAKTQVSVADETVSNSFAEDDDREDVERHEASQMREYASLGNGSYRTTPRHYD